MWWWAVTTSEQLQNDEIDFKKMQMLFSGSSSNFYPQLIYFDFIAWCPCQCRAVFMENVKAESSICPLAVAYPHVSSFLRFYQSHWLLSQGCSSVTKSSSHLSWGISFIKNAARALRSAAAALWKGPVICWYLTCGEWKSVSVKKLRDVRLDRLFLSVL